MVLEEGRRIRDLQERRVDDLRRRSVTVASLVGSSVVVVAAVRGKEFGDWRFLVLAGLLVMFIAAGLIHMPRDYIEGPDVESLYAASATGKFTLNALNLDMGRRHYEHWNSNNIGPIKWMTFAFVGQLTAAAGALIGATFGVV